MDEYEQPMAELAGTVLTLAAGSYSEGESDDGDFSTVKYNPNGTYAPAAS